MLIYVGRLVNKVKREPYIDNLGVTHEQEMVNFIDEGEMFMTAVNGTPEDFADLSLNNELVGMILEQRSGTSNKGKGYLINKIVSFLPSDVVQVLVNKKNDVESDDDSYDE